MEIKLNKDLQNLQDRVAFGLTTRQAVFGGMGLALGVATYFFATNKGLSADVATYLLIPIVAPFVALGFVSYNGLTFENLAKVLIRQFFLCQKVLVFRLQNSFYERDKHILKIGGSGLGKARIYVEKNQKTLEKQNEVKKLD